MKFKLVKFKNNKVSYIITEIDDKTYYVAKENQKIVYSKITCYLKKLVDENVIKSIRIPRPKNKEIKDNIGSLLQARKLIKITLRQLYDYFD